jgi:hypothetical protein
VVSEITDTPSTELVHADEIGLERLQRRPIIDRIDSRQLALIKATLAMSESEQHPINDAEVGHFLELSALYDLDPFAREIWIAKSKSGKLLIMVGREGLRKIVNRNGLKMRSAVVYAKDTYSVEYIDNPTDAKEGEWEANGHRAFHRVTHKQNGLGEARGAILGAWARVVDVKSNAEVGWFDAPLSEYMPSNAGSWSPWTKQTSAMIRGAIERQAAKEATPLGGLVVDGEQYVIESTAVEIGAGEGDGTPPGWQLKDPEQVEQIEELMRRAEAAGFPALADVATVQMRLNHQTPEAVAEWIAAGDEQVSIVEDAKVEAERAEKTP